MLEIKPIQSKEEQKTICEKCGTEYKEELFAYKAFEGGALLAVSQFDICGSAAVIDGISQVIGSSDDFEAVFIMGRAVLNFLDLCGVKTVCYDFKDEKNEKYAKMIGFKMTEGRMTISLEGLFTTPCQSGNSYKDTEKP